MKKRICALGLAVLAMLSLTGCVGEFLLAMTVSSAVMSVTDPYALNANWDISLPDGCEEVYGIKEVGRDGNRYHVLRYEETSAIENFLSWSADTEELSSHLELAETVLDGMDIPQELRPDYQSCAWWFDRKEGDSRDALLIFWEDDLLYIVEHYM